VFLEELMGKQKKPRRAVEPFPPLEWDGFFWASTILLEAWEGLQCRLGAYGARSAKKPSDGTTRLTVASPNKDNRTPPSSEQAAAYRYLIAQQNAIRDSILGAVFDEYPDYRAAYYEDYDLDESDDTLPVLDRPEQLRDLIGLSYVHIHSVAREAITYVGYEFGCAWEEEHGLGAMMHRDRVVKVGGADVSILAWIAERDAKPTRGKKRDSGRT
jgi:hypothetical protein